MCVRFLAEEGSTVFDSRALVAVFTVAVLVTSHSDCLTGFREPLSPPYTCHTGLKNVYHYH